MTASPAPVVMVAGLSDTIGAQVARCVLAQGGKVAIAVPKSWQVETTRKELGSERVLVGVVAAQDAEAAAGFVKGAEDALGPITALVVLAGHAESAGEGAVGSDAAGTLGQLLERTLLVGATLARALVGRMRRRRRGTLCFVAPARHESAGANAAASAAALQGYVEGLGRELEHSGVVAILLPAGSEGPLSAGASSASDEAMAAAVCAALERCAASGSL